MKIKYSRFRHNAKQTSFTSPTGPRRQGDEQEHAQYPTNDYVTSGWSCRRPENVCILSSLQSPLTLRHYAIDDYGLHTAQSSQAFIEKVLWISSFKLVIRYCKKISRSLKGSAVRINRSKPKGKVRWKKKKTNKNGSIAAKIWTCSPTSSSAKSCTGTYDH